MDGSDPRTAQITCRQALSLPSRLPRPAETCWSTHAPETEAVGPERTRFDRRIVLCQSLGLLEGVGFKNDERHTVPIISIHSTGKNRPSRLQPFRPILRLRLQRLFAAGAPLPRPKSSPAWPSRRSSRRTGRIRLRLNKRYPEPSNPRDGPKHGSFLHFVSRNSFSLSMPF